MTEQKQTKNTNTMKMTTLNYSSPELALHLFSVEDGFAASPNDDCGASTGKIDFIESEDHYTI